MEEQVEIGGRLRAFILAKYKNQKAFAEVVGVTQGFVSQMVTGRSGIPMEVLAKISNSNNGLNIDWLLTGKGEMFLEKTSPEPGMVEEGGTRYEAAPAQEEPPPALVVTDVTPLLRLMEGMREEMRAREAEMKERVEWLERRVRELEAAAEKGVGVGL